MKRVNKLLEDAILVGIMGRDLGCGGSDFSREIDLELSRKLWNNQEVLLYLYGYWFDSSKHCKCNLAGNLIFQKHEIMVP